MKSLLISGYECDEIKQIVGNMRMLIRWNKRLQTTKPQKKNLNDDSKLQNPVEAFMSHKKLDLKMLQQNDWLSTQLFRLQSTLGFCFDKDEHEWEQMLSKFKSEPSTLENKEWLREQQKLFDRSELLPAHAEKLRDNKLLRPRNATGI